MASEADHVAELLVLLVSVSVAQPSRSSCAACCHPLQSALQVLSCSLVTCRELARGSAAAVRTSNASPGLPQPGRGSEVRPGPDQELPKSYGPYI